MKKTILTIVLLLSISSLLHAQWNTTNTPNIYYSTGNVGIAITTPAMAFHVRSFGAPLAPVTTGTTQSTGGIMRLQGGSSNNVVLDFGSMASSGIWLQTGNASALGTNYPILLNPNGGNVGVGTLDTKGYKLAVNGSVVATSVVVKLYANWPDYVFKKDYQLLPLAEIKSYIDQNQHLPEMPSAKEIAINGQNLGEINQLLTKKVEELTLYLIESNKKQQEQEARLKKLEEQLEAITKK